MPSWRVPTWTFLALFPLAGCGDTADTGKREAVWGTVQFQGKPLEAGMIQFFPATGLGNVQSGGMIRNGSFSLGPEDGPEPGSVRVSITAGAANASATPEAPGAEVKLEKELIPERYNAKSDLLVEVKKGSKNQFEFDLK